MTCPKCGAVNNEGTSFCVSCGTKLEAAPSATQMAAEPLATPVAPETDKKSNKGLFVKIGVAVAVVVVLIALIVVGLKSCGGAKKIDFAKMPLFYQSWNNKGENEVKYILAKDGNGKSKVLEEEVNAVKYSMDGKTIFFGKDYDGEDYDLYYRTVSKKDTSANTKIADGVNWYAPTPDGKNIFYKKKDKLFKADLKNNKTELGDEVVGAPQIAPDQKGVIYTNEDNEVLYSNGKYEIELSDVEGAFAGFSENGKKIIVVEPNKKEEMKESEDFENWEDYVKYTEDYYSTPNTQTISICQVGNNKRPEKISDEVISYQYAFLDDNWTKLYYVNEDKELIYKNGKKEEVKVIEDVEDTYFFGDEKVEEVLVKTFDEGEDETTYSLYYVDGAKTTEILKDEDEINCGDHVFGKLFNSVEVSVNEETGEYDYEYTYYVRDKSKVYEVDLPDEDCGFEYDAENEILYTLEDIDEKDGTGTLMRYEVKKDKIDFAKGKEITDDVDSIKILSADMGKEFVLVYTGSENDELSVYDGKKLVEVSTDLHEIASVLKDGTIVVKEDFDAKNLTYSISKFDGKESVEVVSDVREVVVIDKNLIYYTDEDLELYRTNGKPGKEVLVDGDDEYSIEHPWNKMGYLSYFYNSEELDDMVNFVDFN